MNAPAIPELPPERASARRSAIFRALGDDVMVLPAAPVRYSSRDTDLPYRPDSELFYATGAIEPGSLAVLIGGDAPEWVLFVPPRDPDVELWSGARLGVDAALERFRPAACHPSTEIEERLPALLQRGARIHFRAGSDERVERLVRRALVEARSRGQRTGAGPRGVLDPGGILDELRLRKDPDEVVRIRRAATLTLVGHRAGAATIAPGAGEWEVQAALEAAFRRGGAAGPGFGTIVGSGANACVLHYRDNRDRIPEHGLVLIDAGAEVGLYSGDVTRTYPASGRFSPPQRAVYDLVDAARAGAISAVRPGAKISDVHDAAVRLLVDGLLDLGVLEGAAADLVDTGAYKPFYPHQTSHWLGLDVHDVGDYSCGGEARVLEPGMVLTIEPGLYFRPGGDPRASAYEGIGVRIEDDVLVTESGSENLTRALPSAADEVQAMVGTTS